MNQASTKSQRFLAALCSAAAILLSALAGDSELARRFAKAVVGTGVALVAVQLLNYLAP